MANGNNATIGFEKQIWDAACVLWGHIPAAEYRKVIVGLIFLRYISNAFEKRYQELVAEGDGFEDDRDAYRSCVFFLHSSGAGITLEVYGELSERSKVRHSKCRVPKRNLGFESLTLRQKPSHIKAFAHMTGLFFSLKVTSAYMIFGKSSGVPAGLPCVRQGQDIVHHICRGDLGLVIQMAVNIRRRANIAVTQPLLDLLQRHIVRQKQ